MKAPKIKPIVLKLALAMFGKRSRYSLTDTCQLPASVMDGSKFTEVDNANARLFMAIIQPVTHVHKGGRFVTIPTIITWAEAPNHAMVPANWRAKIVHRAFLFAHGLPAEIPIWIGQPRPKRPRITDVGVLYDFKKRKAG